MSDIRKKLLPYHQRGELACHYYQAQIREQEFYGSQVEVIELITDLLHYIASDKKEDEKLGFVESTLEQSMRNYVAEKACMDNAVKLGTN